MAVARIRTDEVFALLLALLAHVALLAFLVLRPPNAAMLPPPERITVTLSEDVSLNSKSPQPAAKAAADVAPVIAPLPAQPPNPLPTPQPLVKIKPQPSPPKPVPHIAPAPPLKPPLRAIASTAPKTASKIVPAAPAPRPPLTPPLHPTTQAVGGSRLGNDFLKGMSGTQATGAARNPPAAAIGPAVQSALTGAISRQLKPKWAVPQGVDTERLVTVLSWNLNRDGSLAGAPVVLRQEGINDANRPQAARHAEQAVRAVQLAAPFNLPPEYYDAWKRVASFRFDKRLSQ